MCLFSQASTNHTNWTLRYWNVKGAPVCSSQAVSAFLRVCRAQHKWALHNCFLMRAMIALVSVVGPSLKEQENQRLLLSDI